MSPIAPPQPPLPPFCVAVADDRPDRLGARLQLLWMTVLTILVTAWFCTLGAIPAIIALVVAKHVLVAILVNAIDLREAHEAET